MKALSILIALLLAGSAWAASYSSTFPNTEVPLSGWLQGKADGKDWQNVNSLPGMAYGTQNGSGGYDDSTAVVPGNWGPDQTAQATVVIRQAPSAIAEVELRLRTSISASQITGYEFIYSVFPGNTYVQIVRWNGALGQFTFIDGRSVAVKAGDVVSATATGSTLTTSVNGRAIFSVTDSTFKNGSPGVGFYTQAAGMNQNFGLTNFSASDGGGASTPTPVPTATPTPTATPVPTPAPPGHFRIWWDKHADWIRQNPPIADQ